MQEEAEHDANYWKTRHMLLTEKHRRLEKRNGELLNACNGLLGLLTLLSNRDDCPPTIKHWMEGSHRVSDARTAIAKATGSEAA